MRIPRLVSRQYNLGLKLGAFRILIANVMFYVSMVNFVMISMVAYNTTLREELQPYAPWFNFPVFVGVMVCGILLAMVVEFKFVMPSVVTFNNSQWYKHQNPAREDLKLILEKIEELEEKIKELKE